MQKKIVSWFYKILPKTWVNLIGGSSFTRGIRSKLLRPNGSNLLEKANIYWQKKVRFSFEAPIKIALKAEQNGLENSLLKHTLEVFESRENIVVIDIGASFGFLSLVWAKSIASKGKVISFESHPMNHQILYNNFLNNHLNDICTAENLLVGEKEGLESLNLMGITSNRNSLPGKHILSKTQINQVSLDFYLSTKQIEKVDLIKIDVDGSEMNVLIGMQHLLKNQSPLIIIETMEPEVIKLMQTYGYHNYTLNGVVMKDEPVNVYFSKL